MVSLKRGWYFKSTGTDPIVLSLRKRLLFGLVSYSVYSTIVEDGDFLEMKKYLIDKATQDGVY